MEKQANAIDFLGEQGYVLENEELRAVVIPAWGGRIVSLFSKAAEAELLRTPPNAQSYWEAPLVYGVPVLFPPNRIKEGRFLFQGQSYQFERNEAGGRNHIHGLVQSRAWDVDGIEGGSEARKLVLMFDSRSHPDVMSQFPHRFRLEMKWSCRTVMPE